MNEWILRKHKISNKIHQLISLEKERISKKYSYIIKDEQFFIFLIKEVFLLLKNNTNLLNRLNANQLREIPPIIYNIIKVLFSSERVVFKEEKFLTKISNLYSFIYSAANQVSKNKKKYIGQTALPRTIEREWGTIKVMLDH